MNVRLRGPPDGARSNPSHNPFALIPPYTTRKPGLSEQPQGRVLTITPEVL